MTEKSQTFTVAQQAPAPWARDVFLKILRQYGSEPYSHVAINAAWEAALAAQPPAAPVNATPPEPYWLPFKVVGGCIHDAKGNYVAELSSPFGASVRDEMARFLTAAANASVERPAAPSALSNLTPNATTIAALQEAELLPAAPVEAGPFPGEDDDGNVGIAPPRSSATAPVETPDQGSMYELVREQASVKSVNKASIERRERIQQALDDGKPVEPVQSCSADTEAVTEGCSDEHCEFFEMLWKWFADESRHGAAEMRANNLDGGLSAADFEEMLNEHEASILHVPPQSPEVTQEDNDAAR